MTFSMVPNGASRERDYQSAYRAVVRAAGVFAATAAAIGIVYATSVHFPDIPSQSYPAFELLFVVVLIWLGQLEALILVAVSALLIAYYLLDGEGFAIARHKDAVGLIIAIFSGLLLITLVDQIASRLRSLELAHKALLDEQAVQAIALSEIQHRILNDLGSLSSLALLNSNHAEQPETKEALGKLAARIQVFGTIYRRLNTHGARPGTVEMAVYLSDLVDDIRSAQLGMRPISLQTQVEKLTLDLKHAASIGLILNEAITNALKYAFPNDRPGVIWVEFGRQDAPAGLHLKVIDDGIGPQNGHVGGSGLGSRILRGTAAQLGGSYSLERIEGNTIAHLTILDPAPRA